MMKKLLAVALMFLVIPVFAADSKVAETVGLKVNFSMKTQDEQGKLEQYSIKNNLEIAADNHEWTLIQNDKAGRNPPHHLLLARIVAADTEKVRVNFLIVDTSNTPHVVSRPELIVNYGQKGELVLKDSNPTIQLIVTADQNLKI
jgi:hypothetical protein